MWILSRFQTYQHCSTLHCGEKMTRLAFGDREIGELTDHFQVLLEKNGCDISNMQKKWTRLKTYIFSLLHNNPKESYLEIWRRTFTNSEVMTECKNIMHIFKILMIVSYTNVIVEQL